jgi:hypothetical protein
MSSTLPSRRGRAPRTDAEWAREIQRRVETLESSSSVRVGDWVLNSRGGDLIATTPGSKVVLSDPILTPATVSRPVKPSNIVEQSQQSTGLDLSSPQAFFESLISILTGNDGPQQIFDSIGTQLAAFNAELEQNVAALMENIKEFLKVEEWQAFLDSLFQNLTGTKPDTTISPNDATDQFALLMATTASQATSIAQLLALVNKPVNGIVGGDDFERTDGPLGSGWRIYTDNSNGTYEVKGGEAVWPRTGILANYVRCFRVNSPDAQTATPYQAITRVTGTRVLQTIALAESADDIVFGRVSNDHKAYVMAWWDVDVGGKGRLHLGYNLGSGEELVQRVPCDKPAVGVPLTLQCGDDNPDPGRAPYSYRVLRGSTVLIEWDDPTRITQPLAGNRGWGFGGRSVFGAFGQFTPSSVHSVTVADTRSP